MSNVFKVNLGNGSAPCKDCKNRTLGCHSNCDEYILYRSDRDKFLKEKFEAREKDNLAFPPSLKSRARET